MNPAAESSVEHPDVTFVAMTASVALEHTDVAQTLVSQPSTGATTDEFADREKREIKLEGLKQLVVELVAS